VIEEIMMARSAKVIHPRKIGVSSLRMGPFYTVASIELGNTTTKCIVMSTNLETAEIFEIGKEVRMTREVRPPEPDEEIFGRTLAGVDLTHGSVSEMVSTLILETLSKTRLELETDLHFVVRSTGVTAGFTEPTEVGIMVKALADGCLVAGVPPRKMTASISADNFPPDIMEYSWLQKVYFDGAVASSTPPSNLDIVANEMEGELVTAGLKGASKSTNIDFRNPVLTLDFGTTLAGRITDNGHPYAKTIGSFAGLAGAIPDALAVGSGLVTGPAVSALDIVSKHNKWVEPDLSWIDEIHEHVRVSLVKGGTRFGTVPVNPKAAKEADVVLLGVDVGKNGSDLLKLEDIGAEITEEGGPNLLFSAIDHVQARLVDRIVSLASETGLLLTNTSLGLTGRALVSGRKPELVQKKMSTYSNLPPLFVHDGLAMGAAVAARCMNSLGTTRNPMGGRKGDGCVMGARMKMQKDRRNHK
jgi:putative methanogenesis marker protein 14